MCLSEESTSFLSSGCFSLSRSAYISPLRIFRYSGRECDAEPTPLHEGSVRSFSWVLASTPGTTGFRGLPERKREKERIYCYSRRVRRQRRTVHFSYFLCFARAFRLDPRRENRQYTWSSEQEDMWCWRLENIAEKGFYCLPRPVVAREYAYDVIFLQHWGNTEDAHIPPSSSSSHRGPLGSGSFVRSGSGHCILAAAAAGKEGNLSASPPSPRIITRERPRSTYSHRVCFRPQIQRNLDKTFPPLHVFPCCGKQGLHSVVSGNFGAEAGRLLAGREK